MINLRRGPSEHLSWAELACNDGTIYPLEWRDDRAVCLAVTFEDIRALLGGEPLTVTSGYRTKAYNNRLEGAASKSQHLDGRAIDFKHPTMKPRDVFLEIRDAHRRSELPLLGGLGLYRTFVHFDVRPRIRVGYLATWAGSGVTLPR